jgi:hypothetical protein
MNSHTWGVFYPLWALSGRQISEKINIDIIFLNDTDSLSACYKSNEYPATSTMTKEGLYVNHKTLHPVFIFDADCKS